MKRPAGYMERRRPQRGVAAVEMAFVLLFVLVLLPYPVLLGRAYWHLMALQKIAYQGARYMSTVPVADMKSKAKALQAVAVVQAMADAAASDFSEAPSLVVMCGAWPCGFLATVPEYVSVGLNGALEDRIFGAITMNGREPLLTLPTVVATMPYVGGCDPCCKRVLPCP